MRARRSVWLVFRREVREGLRGRQFLLSTVLVLVILGAIVLVSALTGKNGKVDVGIGSPTPPALVRVLESTHVSLHRYATDAAARDAVAHRKVAVAFASRGRLLLERSDSSAAAVAVAQAAARAAFLPARARQAGITPAQARALLAPPVALVPVEPASGAGGDATGLALASTIVLFIAVSTFGQLVLMSVIQEKAGRVVEVLLAAIRPWQLLAGKVAGIGLLGLSQVALIVVAAYGAKAGGLISIPSLGRTAPLVVACFLCGFALYSVAFASVGALVSRIEDATGAALPVSLTMLAAYLVSFGQLKSPDSGLANALTLIPLTAPFALPARAALTSVPVWEYVLSFAGMLGAVWLLVRVAGRVYELGLLRSGPRVPFREALQAARRATA